MLTEIKEGFRYVRTQVWLWGTFLAATLAYLIFWGPAEVLLPFIVKEEMGGSASDLGLILAMGGIGAMLAAIVMGNREMPRRNMTFMYVVWAVSTLMIAGYGFAKFPWQAMIFCFFFNALESAGLIVWITTKQRLVPGRLLGRVSSFDWFISIGLVPLSYALTGPVAQAFGARTTLVVAGVLGGVVTLAFLFLPGMRSVEGRTGLVVAAGAGREPTAPPELAPPEIAPQSLAPALVAVPAVRVDALPAAVDAMDVAPASVVPEDDTVVGYLETLTSMRAAVDRWWTSREALNDDLETLEREEARLVAEAERIRVRLAEVRIRMGSLRTLREGYRVAESDVLGPRDPFEVEAG